MSDSAWGQLSTQRCKIWQSTVRRAKKNLLKKEKILERKTVFSPDTLVKCTKKITCYKLLKKTLLLTFCVVGMLIIVTELDKLLKIGPLQLSLAVSGSSVKI